MVEKESLAFDLTKHASASLLRLAADSRDTIPGSKYSRFDYYRKLTEGAERFSRTLPNSHAFGRADNVAAIQFVQHFVPAAGVEIVSD